MANEVTNLELLTALVAKLGQAAGQAAYEKIMKIKGAK